LPKSHMLVGEHDCKKNAQTVLEDKMNEKEIPGI